MMIPVVGTVVQVPPVVRVEDVVGSVDHQELTPGTPRRLNGRKLLLQLSMLFCLLTLVLEKSLSSMKVWGFYVFVFVFKGNYSPTLQ